MGTGRNSKRHVNIDCIEGFSKINIDTYSRALYSQSDKSFDFSLFLLSFESIKDISIGAMIQL